MALRDKNYLFTRRIADLGSDEIVFDSQDRKILETGPKDVIWDEIIGKGEHPEDSDGYKIQETNSKAFIRDENNGEEEYPEGCNNNYLSPPCFDDYGDEEVSNEDCWWVTQALNVSFVERKITRASLKCAKVSPCIQRDDDLLIYGIEGIHLDKDVGWELIPIAYYKDSCQHEKYTCVLAIPINGGHENFYFVRI